MIITVSCTLLIAVWLLEVIGYTFLVPDPIAPSRKSNAAQKLLGTLAYGVAYILSLLRAPLGLIPYIAKLFIFFVLNICYEARRTNYLQELLNMIGDFLNLGLTFVFVQLFVGSLSIAHPLPLILFYVPMMAEAIRLLAERITTIFSAIWQMLPHRSIALIIQAHIGDAGFWSIVTRCLYRYYRYYALSDTQRADYILQALKQKARNDPEVAKRLAYVCSFRIVPHHYGLRGGLVRDVATGEIFLHDIWTNDPWLLIGMALRRSPWPFDPRFQQRPFYYMSGANRLTSLFILRHAHYSLPYAIFQLGHEIRVARLHCFYVLLRWLGADIERKVSFDGTFQNDQFIFWLKKTFQDKTLMIPRPLATDEEVIHEVLQDSSSTLSLSALDIAMHYTYPLQYVEAVLLPKIMLYKKLHSTTALSSTNDRP